MTNPQETVANYLATFNETDPARRRALLEALYDESSTYTDPHVDVRGPEQIDAFISATQERFPGVRFTLASAIDAHHDQMRFQWQAGQDGAPPAHFGFDVLVVRDDKIASVLGFSDPAPKAA